MVQSEKIIQIKELVTTVFEKQKLIGLSVGLVDENGLYSSEHVGYANPEQKITATDDTLYCVGSTSKSYTTMLLAMLQDEGKLSFSDTVRTHLPEFSMRDSYVQEHLTIQDLCTHMSGIGDNDGAWIGRKIDESTILTFFATIESSFSFREIWHYNNWCYALLGVIIERVTTQPFNEVVKELIFEPLGLKSATFDIFEAQQSNKLAQPYRKNDDLTSIKTEYANLQNLGPAGSLCISIKEMATWLAFHINNGNHAGQQLISEAGFKQLIFPRVLTQETSRAFDEEDIISYGYAWFIEVYKQKKIISHTGGINGFTTYVAYCPEAKQAVILCANTYVEKSVYPLMGEILDIIFDFSPSHRFNNLNAIEDIEQPQPQIADFSTNALSLPAGTYVNPAYGTIKVEQVEKQFLITINDAKPQPIYSDENDNLYFQPYIELGEGEFIPFYFAQENVLGKQALFAQYEATLKHAIKFEKQEQF